MRDYFLTGWRQIGDFLGVKDPKALKKYSDKYGLPVRRLPGNQPVAIPAEIEIWLVEFDTRRRALEKKKKSKK